MKKITSVAIIGLGSLGGFVCDTLSKIENIKKMVIIDYDTVQEKNLVNSIYRYDDIGKLKVNCILEIISKNNCNLEIFSITKKYTEGKTNLPKTDIVIDCRDFIYDRGNEIDVRLYVSSRYLIIDCRKNVSYSKHFEGVYINQLVKTDLMNAAILSSSLIQNEMILDLIRKQVFHKIELDYASRKTSELMQCRNDLVIDLKENSVNFLNLECLGRIIDLNKKRDLPIYLGDKENSLISKNILRGILKTPQDVISCLTSLTNLPFAFNSYIICIKDNYNPYIELIPETGSA